MSIDSYNDYSLAEAGVERDRSVIFLDLNIGKNAMVGAGAVVSSDVLDN